MSPLSAEIIPDRRTVGKRKTSDRSGPSPASLEAWRHMQAALKAWDTDGALAILEDARGTDIRTAEEPYWYIGGRLEDWFKRAYDRLEALPPDALSARVYHDPAGLMAHLRAVAAGEDPPALRCDPCTGPGEPQAFPPAPTPRPKERPAQRNLGTLAQVMADLGIMSLAELPDAIREMPRVVTLEQARAWDPVAEIFCARCDRLRDMGLDPDDESPEAWVRRWSVLTV